MSTFVRQNRTEVLADRCVDPPQRLFACVDPHEWLRIRISEGVVHYRRDWLVKPWIGAVAVAAAIFAVPATALAGPNDPALVKFKLEVGLSREELIRVAEASRKSSGADYLVANTLDMV